jgi:predicted N-acetyltransferase YhbS
MEACLRRADLGGHRAIVLIGDPEYYGRFGFTADATTHWDVPGPVEQRRLLARVAPGVMLPVTGLLGPSEPRRLAA